MNDRTISQKFLFLVKQVIFTKANKHTVLPNLIF